MRYLFLLLIITSLSSCVEKPDESVKVPEVLIIDDFLRKDAWGVNNSLIQILHYSESDIYTVYDSILYYYTLYNIGEKPKGNKFIIDSLTETIGSRIDIYNLEADSLNNLITEQTKKRDKFYKTNKRKRYREDYQNWVAFKRNNSNVFLRIDDLNDSIESFIRFQKKINGFNGMQQDSVLSKYSIVKVKAEKFGDIKKSYIKCLLIASGKGFEVLQRKKRFIYK